MIRALILILAIPSLSLAEDRGRGFGYCENDIRQGWHFYCDPEALPPEPEEEDLPPPPPAAAASPATASETMEALRAALDELKNRAILDPTEANVSAYMGAQMAVTRKAGAFAAQWQAALRSNPHLDPNVKNPVSALGGEAYQAALSADREEALRDAAGSAGLLFVFEAPARCPVCAIQSRIMATIADRFGISILPVSSDGSVTPEFPSPLPDTGQLKRFGIAEFPKPLLAIIEPGQGAIALIGSGLLTEDMILERVYAATRTTPETRYADGPFVDRQGTAEDRKALLAEYEATLLQLMEGLQQ